MTIVGTQKGNTIITGDSIHFVKEGLLSKDDLLKDQESFMPVVIGCGIVTTLFLVLGVCKNIN